MICLELTRDNNSFVLYSRIMDTKLTLTLDKTVIEAAKELAKQSGRSLSDLVENYLKTLIMQRESEGTSGDFGSFIVSDSSSPYYSERLKNLRGIAKDDDPRDYKEQLADLRKKRLL